MSGTKGYFCLSLYKACTREVNVPAEPGHPEGSQVTKRGERGNQPLTQQVPSWGSSFFPFFLHQQASRMEGDFKFLPHLPGAGVSR